MERRQHWKVQLHVYHVVLVNLEMHACNVAVGSIVPGLIMMRPNAVCVLLVLLKLLKGQLRVCLVCQEHTKIKRSIQNVSSANAIRSHQTLPPQSVVPAVLAEFRILAVLHAPHVALDNLKWK